MFLRVPLWFQTSKLKGKALKMFAGLSQLRDVPGRNTRFAWFMAFAAGAVSVLGFAPFEWAWLPPLCLAVLFALWLDASPRSAFWRGWWFGVGQFAFGTSWIYISLHEFGKLPFLIAGPMLGLLVAIMALFMGIAGWLAVRIGRGRATPWRLLAMPLSWVLLEWVRGWFLTGFPWLAMGYSQTDTVLKAYAPVLGVFGVSLVVALTAALLVLGVTGERRERLAAVIGVGVLALGAAGLGKVQWTHPAGKPLTVALVQGNVPQELKWDPKAFDQTLKKYEKLSAGYWHNDLVVWPEAAIPGLYRDLPDGYLDDIERARKAGGADWLTGVLAADPGLDHYYNTVMEAGDAPHFYVKRHLVPFGEYFPVPQTVRRWLRLMNLPYTDFTPGNADQPLLHIRGVPVSVSICYEIVFGRVIRHDLPEAKFLLNVSNDAWFGDSIGPEQHFQIARMRAIEVGRYLIRDTNTGITAIVKSDGKVLQRGAREKALVLTGQVRPETGKTPWVLLGNLGVLALLAFGYGLIGLLSKRLLAA